MVFGLDIVFKSQVISDCIKKCVLNLLHSSQQSCLLCFNDQKVMLQLNICFISGTSLMIHTSKSVTIKCSDKQLVLLITLNCPLTEKPIIQIQLYHEKFSLHFFNFTLCVFKVKLLACNVLHRKLIRLALKTNHVND